MKTKNQQPNSEAAFLSIDEWQDDDPITGSWFDNPLVGTFGVIATLACPFSVSFMSAQADANRRTQARAEAEASLRQAESLIPSEPDSVAEALAGLNANVLELSLRYLANRANFDLGQKKAVHMCEKVSGTNGTVGMSPARNLPYDVDRIWNK